MQKLENNVKNHIIQQCREWFGDNFIECLFVRTSGPSLDIYVDLKTTQTIPLEYHSQLFEWCREQGYCSITLMPGLKSERTVIHGTK